MQSIFRPMESYSSIITTRLSLAHLPTLDPPGPWLEFDPKGGCYGKANVLLSAGTDVPNNSENSANLSMDPSVCKRPATFLAVPRFAC